MSLVTRYGAGKGLHVFKNLSSGSIIGEQNAEQLTYSVSILRKGNSMEKGRYRVLIVLGQADDNRLLQVDFTNLAEVSKVLMAASFQKAVTILEAERPDIILVELTVENKTALTLLSQLANQASDIPIVVFSATTTEETVGRLTQAGATDIICRDDLSPAFISRLISHTVTRNSLEFELKTYISRLNTYEKNHRQLQDLAINLIHQMAQPLQVLGNTLDITSSVQEDESFQLCRRMVDRVSKLLKKFRQDCRSTIDGRDYSRI